MYVNPLSIFRNIYKTQLMELMMQFQPAYFQIPTMAININLDHIDRRVIIRDNGISGQIKILLSNVIFWSRQKRGTDARGFRGGRFSG